MGEITKSDFRKELEELKRLEALASKTGVKTYQEEADIKRSLLMSYEGMARELMVIASGKDVAFQRTVKGLVDNKDVEGIHGLWTKLREDK